LVETNGFPDKVSPVPPVIHTSLHGLTISATDGLISIGVHSHRSDGTMPESNPFSTLHSKWYRLKSMLRPLVCVWHVLSDDHTLTYKSIHPLFLNGGLLAVILFKLASLSL
jgi:hypothetical protein